MEHIGNPELTERRMAQPLEHYWGRRWESQEQKRDLGRWLWGGDIVPRSGRKGFPADF